MIPLTGKQEELLDYLRSCPRCPSFDEMREALGLKGKSGIHRLISALEERGYIRRIANRSRAIELVAQPHLPRTLGGFGNTELALEAKRRGLVLGHYHRSKEGHRTFVPMGMW